MDTEESIRESINNVTPRWVNLGKNKKVFLTKKLINEIQEEETKEGGVLPFLTILPWLIKGAVGLGSVAAAGSTVYKNIKDANAVSKAENAEKPNDGAGLYMYKGGDYEEEGDGLYLDKGAGLYLDKGAGLYLDKGAGLYLDKGAGLYLDKGAGLYLDPYVGGSLKRYLNMRLKRSGKPIPAEFKTFLKSFDSPLKIERRGNGLYLEPFTPI